MTRTNVSSKIEQRSISERTSDIRKWGNTLKTHGFFGTGLGAYTVALSSEAGDRKVPVHAAPLLAVAEVGLFGVLLLATSTTFFRLRFAMKPEFLMLIPLLAFDHYLFSLWAGQVLLAALLFQMFEVGNNDEADNNEK
jgi:hypothetical protein